MKNRINSIDYPSAWLNLGSLGTPAFKIDTTTPEVKIISPINGSYTNPSDNLKYIEGEYRDWATGSGVASVNIRIKTQDSSRNMTSSGAWSSTETWLDQKVDNLLAHYKLDGNADDATGNLD